MLFFFYFGNITTALCILRWYRTILFRVGFISVLSIFNFNNITCYFLSIVDLLVNCITVIKKFPICWNYIFQIRLIIFFQYDIKALAVDFFWTVSNIKSITTTKNARNCLHGGNISTLFCRFSLSSLLFMVVGCNAIAM